MARFFVIGTPIGNLQDLSQRSIQCLRETELLFAEDTRVGLKLLNHLGASCRVVRADEYTSAQKIPELLNALDEGKTCSYVSDAGMPGISDPGSALVDAAFSHGVQVEVIPGPSALTCAIAVSGFSLKGFSFHGFAPRKHKERDEFFRSLAFYPGAHVLYESPHRICDLLECMMKWLPERQIALCRELTKLHEEIRRGTAQQLYEYLITKDRVRGEIALVIDALRDVKGRELSLVECCAQLLSEQNLELVKGSMSAEDWVMKRVEEAQKTGTRLPKKSVLAKELSQFCSISKEEAYDVLLLLEQKK